MRLNKAKPYHAGASTRLTYPNRLQPILSLVRMLLQ